jgi:ribosomal protein L32E
MMPVADDDLQPRGAETHDRRHPARFSRDVSSPFNEFASGEWRRPTGSLHSFRTLRYGR